MSENERQHEEAAKELWLKTHAPLAAPAYKLIAQLLAAEPSVKAVAALMPTREALMLGASFSEALQYARYHYASCLGAAVEHVEMAMEAHDAGADRLAELAAKKARLMALAHEVLS